MDSPRNSTSRLVNVPKIDGGFGFTLRHFVVYPQDEQQSSSEIDDPSCSSPASSLRSAPSAGGWEAMDTIFVKEVRRSGAAEKAGLHQGDQIVAVNGKPVSGLTYTQVVTLIQSSENQVDLVVLPREHDELQMAYKDSAYEPAVGEPYKGPPQGIPTPPIPSRNVTSRTPSSSSVASASSSEERLVNRRGSGEDKPKTARLQTPPYAHHPPYTRSLTTSQLPVPPPTFSSVTAQSVPDMHRQRSITDRMKPYDSVDETSSSQNKQERLLKCGESVATRTAKFEKFTSKSSPKPETVPFYFKDGDKPKGLPHRRPHRPAIRQTSYLNAINSPNRNSDPTPSSGSVPSVQPSTEFGLRSASNIALAVMQSEAHSEGSTRTHLSTAEEKESKIIHRTSYITAADKNKILSHSSTERSHSVEERIERPQDSENSNISLSPPASSTQATTPTKAGKKFRNPFSQSTDKTPRIVEERSDVSVAANSSTDLIYEGRLLFKVDLLPDGKRSSDRSWKPAWAQIRGQLMYLFKEKPEESEPSSSSSQPEETPIPVSSCVVDIAYEYVKKKKNVLRVTTNEESQYLIQTETKEEMTNWAKAISTQNDADETAKIVQKRTTSPQVTHKSTSKPKMPKALSRSRNPAVSLPSPSAKQKRQHTTEKVDDEPQRTWKQMAKKFTTRTRHGSQSNVPTTEPTCGTFNLPLSGCPCSDSNPGVPMIVEKCCEAVEERGLDTTGIYRVPGNKAAVKMLQEELSKAPINFKSITENDKWQDVHVVTSLLKSFFRQLPDPIVTKDTYDQFMQANRYDDKNRRMLHLKRRLAQLPDHNRETFQYLARHLSKVAENGEANKMDIRNLAIIFGPTLVRRTDDSMLSLVSDMSDQCQIVQSVITHHDWFFGSWEKDSEIPEDEFTKESVKVSGMNNQALIEHAEVIEYGEKKKRKVKKDKWKSCDSEPPTIERDAASDSGYSERNIDREIELRKAVNQPSVAEESEVHVNVKIHEAYDEKNMPPPLTLEDRETLRKEAERAASQSATHERHLRHLDELIARTEKEIEQDEHASRREARCGSLDSLEHYKFSDEDVSSLTDLFSNMKRPGSDDSEDSTIVGRLINSATAVRRRRQYRMGARRRHTVAGVIEMEAFKAALARMCQNESVEKESAWSRLNPKPSRDPTPRNLPSWCRQQRQMNRPNQIQSPTTESAGQTPFPRHVHYESSI